MYSERYQFINLTKLPGRLNTEEVAWCLGFAAHDIAILVAKGLLKPLGNPPQNGTRYFSSSEMERLRLDTKWLDQASACLIRHWKKKNEQRPKNMTKEAQSTGSSSINPALQNAQ